MFGAGMLGRVMIVTEGDLVCSGRRPTTRLPEPANQGISQGVGVIEESERLIVVLTLGESREERRGRSQEERV